MSSVNAEWLKNHPTSGSVEDPNNNLKFDAHAADGKLFQSEYQLGLDGQQIFRDTRKIEWIIGAGQNGFGGLLRIGDYVFQAPLSFYSKAQRWELSPGYELGNSGFNRPILPGCIACHSGRANTLPEGNGHFANPTFSELAIGCENCHGPGLAHVLSAQMGQNAYEGHDTSIVNPASLPPALTNDICMFCHQTGDVRVLKPGKDYHSFRPGAALDDTLSIFLVPPKRESPPQQDLLEHYYSMTLSKCYRGSGERLTCISCHDPHVEPSAEEAPAYFRKKCLACHNEKSCPLSLQVRAGVKKTIVYTDLAEALVKLDRTREAVSALESAKELDPFNAGLRKQMIVQLIQLKDYARAEKEMEDYVERFPADSFMRQMLHRAQAIGQAR